VDELRTGAGRPGPPPALAAHLDALLGSWPPTGPLHVVGSVCREQPGWDGTVCPALAVVALGGTVLSVPPGQVGRVGALVADRGLPAVLGHLGPAVQQRSLRTVRWVLRYCTDPPALPPAGSWVSVADLPGPDWLRPFGGEVLVAVDDAGQHLGGVGIKRHPGGGAEIAVVVARRGRGRGLGRRLVAQAARRLRDEGAVPTYLHLADNVASARLATAAGFPDRGWEMVGALPPLSGWVRLQQLATRARLQQLVGRR
jgi:GNAT superfamily N-acetyltransferase